MEQAPQTRRTKNLVLWGPTLGVHSRPRVPSMQGSEVKARVLLRGLSRYLALVGLTAASQMSDVYQDLWGEGSWGQEQPSAAWKCSVNTC